MWEGWPYATLNKTGYETTVFSITNYLLTGDAQFNVIYLASDYKY